MNKYLYAILRLKTTSWIKYWLYNKTMKIKGVLSNILDGISFYLTDSLNRKFNLFQIIGRSVQDGTPTPENPIPIKNTGDNGSINEKVQNFNIWDEEWELGGLSSAGVPVTANDRIRSKNFISVLPNTQYYGKSPDTMGVRFYDKAQAFISSANGTNQSFTTPQNCFYMKFMVINTTTYNNDICINVSNTALNGTYQPHAEQNISFPLAEGQKFMEDDYLADDGVHRISGEYVFTGNENWQIISLGDNRWQHYINLANVLHSTTEINIKSNIAKGIVIANRTLEGNNNSVYTFTGGLAFRLDEFTTIEAWKNYLAEQYANGTPVKVQYELAQEVIDPYTPEQQIVWEQIKALRTYKNVTIISSKDETPPNLKIQYWKEG